MTSSIQGTEVAVSVNPKYLLSGDASTVVDSFADLIDHSTSKPTFMAGSNNALSRKSSVSLDVADDWENIQRDIDPEDAKIELRDEAEAEEKVAKPTSIDRSSLLLRSIHSDFEVDHDVESPQVNNISDPTLENARRASASRSERPQDTVTTNHTAEKNVLNSHKEPGPGIEEKRLKKEKEIFFPRHKLQKGLLNRDQQPKDEEIEQMSEFITQLEGYPDLEASIIRITKIHKVLKAILKLDEIPKNSEFQFKDRCKSLLEMWNKILESAEQLNASVTPHPGAEASKEDKMADKQDNSEEEAKSTKHAADSGIIIEDVLVGTEPIVKHKEINGSSGDFRPAFRPKTVAPRPYRPQTVTSYREFFNISDQDNFFYDKSFLLLPFNRIVYVNQTTFTIHDFHRYAWLLAQSEECWYEMPSATTLARMRTDGIEKRRPIANPKPDLRGMAIPIVLASDCLYLNAYGDIGVERVGWGECDLLHPNDLNEKDRAATEDSDDDDDDNASSSSEGSNEETEGKRFCRDSWRCEKCHEKYVQLHEEVGWIYLSVVRTDVRGSGDGQGGTGTGMFMLRKSGTQEQAAARAFHDAGALSFSTVFCCAMRADAELLGWKGKVKKVLSRVQEVLTPEEGVLRVYF